MDHQEGTQPNPEEIGVIPDNTIEGQHPNVSLTPEQQELVEQRQRILEYVNKRLDLIVDSNGPDGKPLSPEIQESRLRQAQHEADLMIVSELQAAARNVPIEPLVIESALLLGLKSREKEYFEEQGRSDSSSEDIMKLLDEIHRNNPLTKTDFLKEVMGVPTPPDTSEAQAQIREEPQGHLTPNESSFPSKPTE